jgi:hypothetical protein
MYQRMPENSISMPSPQDHEAALFALAAGKPVSERESFLQAVCGSDKPLANASKPCL